MAASESAKETVLLVVPERHIRRLAEVNLQRQGFAVNCAGSAEEALRIAESRSQCSRESFSWSGNAS